MSEPPPRASDVAVVGAGIVGLAVARELVERHPGLRVAVLERESAIAAHQTGHSSGVIHAGVYYEPGSLKARLCVEGAAALYAFCAEHAIDARREGKLIVATREDELAALGELERRGRENGVPGLSRLDPAQMREVEPHASGLAALHSPATGVVDFTAVAAALARLVESGGGSVSTECEVLEIEERDSQAVLRHARGETRVNAAVVCAGAWSDRLAPRAGVAEDVRTVPFRGAYLRLRPDRASLVRASIYPVPDPRLPFLGAHLTRGADGSVLLGPTALIAPARDAYRLTHVSARDLRDTLLWPGTWRLARRHWRAGATEFAHALVRRTLVDAGRRLVPELRASDFVAGPAGVRGQTLARDGTLVDDFLVDRSARAIHVRNAPSPAATSALALARLVADQVEALPW